MTLIEYLSRLRALTPTGSIYAVAQLLEMKEDTVRAWTRGKFPDAYACSKIAQVLDMPFEQVTADIYAEAANDPVKKAYWADLARKFAACVVMGSAITMLPTDARSATGQATTEGMDAGRAISSRLVSYAKRLCTNYATQLLSGVREFFRRGCGGFPGFAS